MKNKLIIFSVLVLALCAKVVMATGMVMEPYKGGVELEKLKSLAGTWQGTHKMGDTEEPAKAIYSVTSNGSAVEEKLFPGTPHEMVTMYYEKKGKLQMTHYCAMGNQPQMNLVSSDNNKFFFDLAAGSDINVTSEGHMHALSISFVDANHIVQNWTMYQEGKEEGTTVIDLKRAP